jgi:2-polyprenyl-6-hydroxyphenyl methylase / 3-demethylubiquinone-9 3-methyltransferase
MNADPQEIKKFEALAHRWWDPASEFKPLHQINPLRLDYIDGKAKIAGKNVLDIGCGGGILAESMAARGAKVTGIDLAEKALTVAKLHLMESGRRVDYRLIAAEDLAAERAHVFDVVTCMEMLEHVPHPARIVQACAALVAPGGWLFFATLNRNPKSYLYAVIGAEYVLRLLPRGTHDYAKFIKPSELGGWCREAGLAAEQLIGMHYNPLTQVYSLGPDVSVNYILCARAQ